LALINLGQIALSQGNQSQATALLLESLVTAQEIEDMTLTAWSLRSLASVASLQSDYAQMTALHIQSLTLSRTLNDWWGMTECMEGLAWAMCNQGQITARSLRLTLAARLLGAAAALRHSTSNPLSVDYRVRYDRILAPIRAQLDETAFAAAWEAGQAMTLEQAIAFALEGSVGDIERLVPTTAAAQQRG
jgi:non-specific serine/threonine protein kinase